jgi:hypothetical protein
LNVVWGTHKGGLVAYIWYSDKGIVVYGTPKGGFVSWGTDKKGGGVVLLSYLFNLSLLNTKYSVF